MATGTVTAMPSREARSNAAEPTRGANRSAASVPTPASSTSASRSSDSSSSERSHLSEKSGSRVVRLMKTKPWVAKAPATARRVRPRVTRRIVADLPLA